MASAGIYNRTRETARRPRGLGLGGGLIEKGLKGDCADMMTSYCSLPA